jgi:hypothetical protein
MSRAETFVLLSISVGFGLGIFSLEFFFVRLLDSNHFVVVDVACLALLLLVYLPRLRRSVNVTPRTPKIADIHAPGWVRSIMAPALVIALLAAIYNAVLREISHPHGEGWDAFSIWNLHARFLFRGGEHWRDGFSALIPWSHPDYPLLLPAAIAHFWSYLGRDAPIVPAIIGIVFVCSTLALLVSGLAYLRGRNAALLAGLTLSSTPFFIEQGTVQYADVPLSFFILASVVLLHLAHNRLPYVDQDRSGPLALAGLAGGFAAWTKNEGLLFLASLVVAYVWPLNGGKVRQQAGIRWARDSRLLTPFLTAAAGMVAAIAIFKHFVAPAGEFFSNSEIIIHKALTPTRYWIILRWFAKELLLFGNWWIIPGTLAMLGFYLLTRRKSDSVETPAFRLSVLCLSLTLAGYFAIYLITPRDLYWHLRFSLSRLFLQFWPATLFLFFLCVARRKPANISK